MACGALAISIIVLGGCGREDVKVYRVDKTDPPAQPSVMPPGHPAVSTGRPTLKYATPKGWEEATPSEMRVASFKVKGEAGKLADVGVFPLPGLAGSDLDNVNRWRGQVGQPPITAEQLEQSAETVQIGGQPAKLWVASGDNPGSGEKTRILAAIQRREGIAWFFKMTGDDGLVDQQKPAFLDFLKSVTFETATTAELPPSHPPIEGMGMGAAPTSGPINTEGKPAWDVPAGWKEVAGGQFLIAKFQIAGAGDAQAAVNVSMSPGEGGGLVGNVNRWRQQVGLDPLPEAEVAKLVTAIDVGGGKASLVDFAGTDARTGQKTRLVGAVIPRGAQTWFYKLMGNEQIVDREKQAFTQFVQSAKYADAAR